MKSFLLHQSADTIVATQIAQRLQRVHGNGTYLNETNPYIARRGEDMAAHIRADRDLCARPFPAILSR